MSIGRLLCAPPGKATQEQGTSTPPIDLSATMNTGFQSTSESCSSLHPRQTLLFTGWVSHQVWLCTVNHTHCAMGFRWQQHRLVFFSRHTRMSQNRTRPSSAVVAKKADSFPGRLLSSPCRHRCGSIIMHVPQPSSSLNYYCMMHMVLGPTQGKEGKAEDEILLTVGGCAPSLVMFIPGSHCTA